nr:MAG TPA: hypothetical protein [Herelleviridae sp.]
MFKICKKFIKKFKNFSKNKEDFCTSLENYINIETSS